MVASLGFLFNAWILRGTHLCVWDCLEELCRLSRRCMCNPPFWDIKPKNWVFRSGVNKKKGRFIKLIHWFCASASFGEWTVVFHYYCVSVCVGHHPVAWRVWSEIGFWPVFGLKGFLQSMSRRHTVSLVVPWSLSGNHVWFLRLFSKELFNLYWQISLTSLSIECCCLLWLEYNNEWSASPASSSQWCNDKRVSVTNTTLKIHPSCLRALEGHLLGWLSMKYSTLFPVGTLHCFSSDTVWNARPWWGTQSSSLLWGQC